MTAELSPERWRKDFNLLKNGVEIDILVVGGGVVGAGVALDAATRGLKVVLVEARDFAAGTSSNSSKLIHGGLRYLKTADFKLVLEALRERGTLLELAPHLVRPLPFLFVLRHRVIERAYVTLGIGIYDLMARIGRTKRQLPRLRQLSRQRASKLAPGLDRDSFIGAVEYHDAQVDDSRFVLDLVRSAVSSGAIALNEVMLTDVKRDGSRVISVQLKDAQTGELLEIQPRSIVLATGVWSERTMALFGSEEEVAIQPSKGVHLVLANQAINSQRALIVPTAKSVLFILPWDGHWIVGTTDTAWEFGIDDVTASSEDIDYLLRQLNTVLSTPVTLEQVEGIYVGLRPLIAALDKETTKLSREHAIGRMAENAISVSGGKFTTYRIMAQAAVDAVVENFTSEVGPSRTDQIALFGARGFEQIWDGRVALANKADLSIEKIEQMIGRYGVAVNEVLEILEKNPVFGRSLQSAPSCLQAEIVHSVTHEGARHIDDLLRRRFHIAIEERDRGIAASHEVAPTMASLLGWTDEKMQDEIELFRQSVEHALAAEHR
ncbi:MAG TPA: glycerol-3-phosphate dehydrogenase/oxidase [Acidimicrobiales bacterium]|nr:glycerol-3-phosphate dehydrogenase/oxidase [Acidimicrobiales bacterium]